MPINKKQLYQKELLIEIKVEKFLMQPILILSVISDQN